MVYGVQPWGFLPRPTNTCITNNYYGGYGGYNNPLFSYMYQRPSAEECKTMRQMTFWNTMGDICGNALGFFAGWKMFKQSNKTVEELQTDKDAKILKRMDNLNIESTKNKIQVGETMFTVYKTKSGSDIKYYYLNSNGQFKQLYNYSESS